MKERDVRFFRPLWRRIAVIAVCAVWAGLELWHGEQMWIVITLGLTVYSVWTFLIAFPKDAPSAIESKESKNVPPQA